MDELTTITSQLTELLSQLDEKDKESMIFKHIETTEKSNEPIVDFPSDLDWFNTSEPLSRRHLNDKIVVLDFFTYCCVNCLHIIPQLRQLEENFSIADGLVVVGVHSAKFDNEKDSENIRQALKRYNVTHPVVNDCNCFMWNKLNISCWPTIVILGPKMRPLFVLLGENHREEMLLYVKAALKYYKGSVSSCQLPTLPYGQVVTSELLSFPGKITRWRTTFAVSDSGNHRVVVFDENGCVKFKIGGKTPGLKDGSFNACLFNSPQGLAFGSESELYVADTENHTIRLVDLKALRVTTVAGTGKQGMDFTGGGKGVEQEISSPWDVCVVPCSDIEATVKMGYALPQPPASGVPPPPPVSSGVPPAPFSSVPPLSSAAPAPPPPPISLSAVPPPPPPAPTSHLSSAVPPPPPSIPSSVPSSPVSSGKVLLIAAAGTHQIWAYFLDDCVWWKGKKYEKHSCVAVAGSGREENRNNRFPMMASFAQPSGLAYSPERKCVFVADSESSSVRKVSMRDGCVSHVVGGAKSPNNLFSYGDVDAKSYEVKLQHPLGVIWSSATDSLFVCDTYNHKIKIVDVDSLSCRTLSSTPAQFSEPSGGCLNEREDELYIADTNNHSIKKINLKSGTVTKVDIREKATGDADTNQRDVWSVDTDVSDSGGRLTLRVEFTPVDVHGKWRAQIGSSKVQMGTLKGKLNSNVAVFEFDVLPSKTDDSIRISFELVLCGKETCTFKSHVLEVMVKRKETAERNVLMEVKKELR